MDDSALLRQFAQTGSHAVFRDLVGRYTSLVYASALTRLRDAHAAQDVTQAVFLTLALKTKDLRPDTSLPATQSERGGVGSRLRGCQRTDQGSGCGNWNLRPSARFRLDLPVFCWELHPDCRHIVEEGSDLIRCHPMQTMTDAQLLEAFSSRQDDNAFAELMRRHAAMVYRTCHRLLKDVHEAEDASQAVFVVLARKAAGLRKGDLSAWLYRVAHHVAAETVRKRMHRTKREESYAAEEVILTESSAAGDIPDPALLGLVDAALLSLPVRYREAVILRYLRNRSETEAAQLAGCAVGTLSMRASRGIQRLRQHFARRGVTLSGAALAGLLASEASAAVPETLLPSILASVKTASATGAVAAAATSTTAMLAKGAMKAMFIVQVKTVALVTAAAIAVGGAGVTTYVAVAKEQAKPVAVRADEMDLMTVKSLTVEQAKAITEGQKQKPPYWKSRYWQETEQEADAGLLAAGATPEQMRRLRAEMSGMRGMRSPSHYNLDQLLSRTTSLEWMRLGNRFANFLTLPALTTLTPEVAAILAKAYRSHLYLPALTALTPETANALVVNGAAGLQIRGLTTLTPETAAALSKCQYSLDLSGLKTITSEAVAKLVRPDHLDIGWENLPPSDLTLSGLTTVTPEVAGELANCRWGILDLSGLTTITPEAAAALIKPKEAQSKDRSRIFSPSRIMLDGLTTLDADVAAALAQFKGGLGLGGLTTLSPAAFKALAEFKGELDLGGITTLTPEMKAAMEKTRLQWRGLSLRGLTTLDADTAKALAEFKGSHLSLAGLTTLSADAARALADLKGGLDLSGLTALDDDAAKAFAEFKGSLILEGLTTISAEAARALARTKRFTLSGITSLDADTARALAQSEAWNGNLPKMTSISADVAKALAEYKGILNLDGLSTLSFEAAKALAEFKGKELSVKGLTTISAGTAQALAGTKAWNGNLPRMTSLSVDTARALAQFDGRRLELQGLTDLTAEAAAALAQLKAWSGLLPEMTSLSADVARALAEFKGDRLEFSNLTNLTAEAAAALAQSKAWSGHLPKMTSLSADVAREFARFKGSLYLSGVTTLSTDAAKALAESKCNSLNLNGLESLSPDAVAALAKCECQRLYLRLTAPSAEDARTLAEAKGRDMLFLYGLALLDVETAKAFAAFPGQWLHLSGLTTLSPEAAAVLANCRCQHLSLDLTTLSPEAAKALAEFKGSHLSLAGLTTLSPEAAAALATCKAQVSLPRHLKLPQPPLRVQASEPRPNPGAVVTSQLVDAGDDYAARLRAAVTSRIGNVDGEKSLPRLEQLLADQDANVRSDAVVALGWIDGEKAKALLEQAARDPNEHVRKAAEDALRRGNSGTQAGQGASVQPRKTGTF